MNQTNRWTGSLFRGSVWGSANFKEELPAPREALRNQVKCRWRSVRQKAPVGKKTPPQNRSTRGKTVKEEWGMTLKSNEWSATSHKKQWMNSSKWRTTTKWRHKNDNQHHKTLTGDSPKQSNPAGKYWSPGRSEDVPLQRPEDVPYRSYLTVPGTSWNDVQRKS